VYLTTAPEPLAAGEYYADSNLHPSSAHAHDAVMGARLWAWTEKQMTPFLPAADVKQPIAWTAA
jgi:hypothetical protein